jgi:hypothetical protein
MPERKYFDIKEQKEVDLPSDCFECARCLCKTFTYKKNPNFLNGESDKEFIRICEGCGEKFAVEKVLDKSRFVLASEIKKKNETKTKER